MRFSLSNRLLPVSHAQFVDYCDTFRGVVESSYGTPCQSYMKVFNAPKEYITFLNDGLQETCDAINEGRIILERAGLEQMTKELWAKSRYVEVIIHPVDEQAAPRSAFAHIDFKGHLPRSATFYCQPDDESVRAEMVQRYPGKAVGDGFASHANGNRFMRGMATQDLMRMLRLG